MRWPLLRKPAPAMPPPPPDDRPDCPICVGINTWFRDDHQPAQKATHGAGGPNWAWSACYEHYRIIATFTLLDNLGKWGQRP